MAELACELATMGSTNRPSLAVALVPAQWLSLLKKHCWHRNKIAWTWRLRAANGSPKRQPRMRREAHRLVFVDETGTSTKMVRSTRARRAKSQRLKGHAPFGHWKTQTFIAGLRRNRLTWAASFVVGSVSR